MLHLMAGLAASQHASHVQFWKEQGGVFEVESYNPVVGHGGAWDRMLICAGVRLSNHDPNFLEVVVAAAGLAAARYVLTSVIVDFG